jgi:hypothetical protein
MAAAGVVLTKGGITPMTDLRRLTELRGYGRMHWIPSEHAWTAEPDDVLAALTGEGFQEYKHEVARSRRDRAPRGGVWQGLDGRTGMVASAVWVQRSDGSRMVFIDIDGEPLVADAIQDVGGLGDGTSPAPPGPARSGGN